MKRYQVSLEASSVTVNATSEYFAAIAYNAERFCSCENHTPLAGATILRVRAVGQRRICRVVWQDVVDQANREAELVFGESIPAGERPAIRPDELESCADSLHRHESAGASHGAWETHGLEMPSRPTAITI